MIQGVTTLGVLATLCRAASRLVEYWPVALAAVVVLSPVSPHVRTTEYRSGACEYLGGRGVQVVRFDQRCPFITIIDTRE